MAQHKVLLVEDDHNFGDVLRTYLEMHGYSVTWANDGEKGAFEFRNGKFDICIFDVMMPRKDGFTLAKEVRQVNQTIPIIFLTAKTHKEDVVQGFKSGADDYINKPFHTEELLFRIQAVLKRGSSATAKQLSEEQVNQNEFKLGLYVFNYSVRSLTIGDSVVKLSPKEADLLRLFCNYTNDILPRTDALKKIWHADNYFTARSMDVFITKLRKYFKDDPRVEFVNIHGNGFQLRIPD